MNAALVTIGDELLAGDTENANATWIARRLTERGVVLERVLTIPDEVDLIARNVREYSEAFDAVLTTGGLGGTPDDLTMAAVADAFDVGLAVDERALENVENALEGVRERYPDIEIDAEAEASIPDGARALLNPDGLSPGCVMENVYVLPGIPEEMHAMFEAIETDFSGSRRSERVFTATPEGKLHGVLEGVREEFDVVVGCYPDSAVRRNRIELVGEDQARLEEAAAWVRERVEKPAPVGADATEE